MSKPPILLLKTQSQPTDPYLTLFSTSYTPHFLPVLTHTFHPSSQIHLHTLFSTPGTFLSTYDSIILTSQRAVEALDSALSHPPENHSSKDQNHAIQETWSQISRPSKPFPIFVVGPATYISVSALISKHFSEGLFVVVGQESGNGEALVEFVLEYGDWAEPKEGRRVLFPTGEKRRDTVPRVLRQNGWMVDEVECYETVTREEFRGEFEGLVRGFGDGVVLWVVVFSPQGCGEMLDACGWTGEGGKVVEECRTAEGRRRRGRDGGGVWVRVMSIGPTTRGFLLDECGFQVDAVAETPSAGGILRALESDLYSGGDKAET